MREGALRARAVGPPGELRRSRFSTRGARRYWDPRGLTKAESQHAEECFRLGQLLRFVGADPPPGPDVPAGPLARSRLERLARAAARERDDFPLDKLSMGGPPPHPAAGPRCIVLLLLARVFNHLGSTLLSASFLLLF